MKTYFRIIVIIFFIFFTQNAVSNEKIKIGLVVPLSGQYAKIGKSVLNASRLALNSINDDRIEILPRDTKSDPVSTYEVSRNLYENFGVKIIIGPIFNNNITELGKLPEITFISLTNKLENNPENVISAGVNAISQLNAIKKFLKKKNLERTIFLLPDSKFKNEIENAINKTQLKLKDKFVYNTDPTLLTAQIEKITRYRQRKQNLINEITRLENSNDPKKEKKIEKLNTKDTLGGINFDSVVIADFDENLKSVATSLLYTDVSSDRVNYITLNQWFDDSLLKESSMQPIYFPSINKKNYDKFSSDFNNSFSYFPNQISFLSYDIIGLVYYLIYKNNYLVEKKIFYKKNRFKGKIGIFEINKNKITHELSFYSAEDKNFIKIF